MEQNLPTPITPSFPTEIKSEEINHSSKFKSIIIGLIAVVILEIIIGGIYLLGGFNLKKAPVNPKIPISISTTPTVSSFAKSPIAPIIDPTYPTTIPTALTTHLSPTITAFPTQSTTKSSAFPAWQLYTNTQDHFSIQAPTPFISAQSTPDDIAIQSPLDSSQNPVVPLSYFDLGYLLSNENTSCSTDSDAYQILNTFEQQTLQFKSNDKFNSSTTTILGRTITGAEEDTSGIVNKGTPYPNHYYYYLCVNKKVFYTEFTIVGNITVTNAQKATIDSILATLKVN